MNDIPIVHTDIPSTPTEHVHGGVKKWDYFPHDDRILVEQHDVDDVSQGGIILSTGGEKAFMGTVVRVGPGKRTETGERLKMQVQVGDIVVFGKYAGMETKLNDERLLVMKEDDIIAIAVEVDDERAARLTRYKTLLLDGMPQAEAWRKSVETEVE